MPASMQWRDQKDITPRSFGEEVRVGSGRRAVSGYLAHSQRVGPGVVVIASALDDQGRAIADRCRDEGFTALAIELPGEDPAGAVVEAARSLVANWHPRVGLLALPGLLGLAHEAHSREPVDAIAVAGGADPADGGQDLDEALDHLGYHLS